MKVAVFGCGVAGLTVAHELSRLGHEVAAFELNPEPGGFFRSARRAENQGMPSEYSWHGMGPWYHNVFDLMRQIPYDSKGSVFDRSLSRPIDFGMFPDRGKAQFYDRGWLSIPRMFEMSGRDFLGWAWLMLKSWASRGRYAHLNAAEEFARVMSERSAKVWRSCFGPWIGSDWRRCSLHTCGHFFRKQLISGPPHQHAADDEGPGWTHGSGDGWLLLRGPSSEVWFEPWMRSLSQVRFHWNEPLQRLHFDGSRVTGAQVEGRDLVEADAYVVATTPFAALDVFGRTPQLLERSDLALFQGLVADGPHLQISSRIAFSEPIRFPRPRTAVVLADTEFNLTLFAQEQAWGPDVWLGEGVGSLWTCTSCTSGVPGRVHGLPVERCSKEQFLDELRAQVLGCGSLDAMVREANQGRGLRDFPILRMEVWHEWEFLPMRCAQPKWVTTTHTQPYQPPQLTSVPNLFLAGSHTNTEVDVWSIEGAVESGRRAARGIDRRVRVLPQYTPWWLRMLTDLGER